MKRILVSILTLAAMTCAADEVRNISFSWDHDGVAVTGFKLYSRPATNVVFVPIMAINATNRTVVVSLTNPPASQQFVMTATNALLESDWSQIVTLNKPGMPGAFKIVTVVTVQTP